MMNGEPLEDFLLVDILVCELHSFPEGCGWIIENFPTTVTQAKVGMGWWGLIYWWDLWFLSF